MTIVSFLLSVMIATVIVLVIGVVLMAIGGKTNDKYSNKLMVARVSLQAVAIILLGLVYMLYKHHS